MTVTCKKCGEHYDDVYRLTYCPHESFEMHAVVANNHGIIGVARSIEELDALLGKARP